MGQADRTQLSGLSLSKDPILALFDPSLLKGSEKGPKRNKPCFRAEKQCQSVTRLCSIKAKLEAIGSPTRPPCSLTSSGLRPCKVSGAFV